VQSILIEADNGLKISIDQSGRVRTIYSDALAPFLSLGDTTIRRASHVEPGEDGKWYADMKPVGGPKLGPFDLRQTALDEEVVWLKENIIV
jgi:hypothetical protein